ncbi:hypothetical protein ASG12_05110 [Williamsia sp. Leaf354]|uniref:hypothetical protein n=1 Tax=Williamsia sp. Leaf354 TaxID=1736349 RepID=UPI0006FA2B9A|nr:hypothetical protein [Williamsia sp. Leaf354]KQS00304.1 hypothetical protein ASG12_05110 [Williamsia sp. Leaf354]
MRASPDEKVISTMTSPSAAPTAHDVPPPPHPAIAAERPSFGATLAGRSTEFKNALIAGGVGIAVAFMAAGFGLGFWAGDSGSSTTAPQQGFSQQGPGQMGSTQGGSTQGGPMGGMTPGGQMGQGQTGSGQTGQGQTGSGQTGSGQTGTGTAGTTTS